MRDQGFEDIQESAAARGRLGAGGTLNDLTEFNNNLASTVAPELQQQRFNQLANILGIGTNAATGQGNASLQTGVNTGNLLTNSGAAQAQGFLKQGKNTVNTLGNVTEVLGAVNSGAFGDFFPKGTRASGGIQSPNQFEAFS